MTEIVRFADYEKRSRNPDACGPRDPCEAAIIIIMPVKPADCAQS